MIFSLGNYSNFLRKVPKPRRPIFHEMEYVFLELSDRSFLECEFDLFTLRLILVHDILVWRQFDYGSEYPPCPGMFSCWVVAVEVIEESFVTGGEISNHL